MKRIPIKEGYINTPQQDVILFYSGLYKVLDNDYHLLFIANSEGIIYDTLLLPASSLEITGNKLVIKGNEEEQFIRINY